LINGNSILKYEFSINGSCKDIIFSKKDNLFAYFDKEELNTISILNLKTGKVLRKIKINDIESDAVITYKNFRQIINFLPLEQYMDLYYIL